MNMIALSSLTSITMKCLTKSLVSHKNLADETIDDQFFCIGNLAAIDCFATIYGQTAYQKTYQDKLEVEKLVNDDRPLNIHKLFTSEDSPSPTMAMPSHIIGQ